MIHHATPQFDFSKLHLSTPAPIQGGSFFSRINVSEVEDSLYIHTPKCGTKQGIVASGSKKYIDFVFTSANSNFIDWVDALESRLQDLIYEKRSSWFVTDALEMDDIENAFIPTMKHKPLGVLMRGYLPQHKQHVVQEVQVYDEYETPVPLESIKESSQVISILDITGIKFNQKCFQLVVHIKQMMVIERPPFSNCMIKLKETPKLLEVEISPDP